MLKKSNSWPPGHGDEGGADWLIVMIVIALLVAGASAFVVGYVLFAATA